MGNRYVNCYSHPVSWQGWWSTRTSGLVRREGLIQFSGGCGPCSLCPDPSTSLWWGTPTSPSVCFYFSLALALEDGCLHAAGASVPQVLWENWKYPGARIPWRPSDEDWVVQDDDEHLAALLESRQIQRHTVVFILTPPLGILGLGCSAARAPAWLFQASFLHWNVLRSGKVLVYIVGVPLHPCTGHGDQTAELVGNKCLSMAY